MRIEELKRRARRAFGENLEHATPANVREFLDTLQKEDWTSGRAERQARTGNANALDLSPSAHLNGLHSWESQMRNYFNLALDRAPEEAAAALWLFALEMAYSGIEEINADTLGRLFDESPP